MFEGYAKISTFCGTSRAAAFGIFKNSRFFHSRPEEIDMVVIFRVHTNSGGNEVSFGNNGSNNRPTSQNNCLV